MRRRAFTFAFTFAFAFAFTFTFAFAFAGCAPSSQILLHVDTDAPVPPAPGAAPDPMRPAWLFDRLRIEVLMPDGSPALGSGAASRDFAVDESTFLDGRASIGVAPPLQTSGLSARVRLFRGDQLVGEDPPARLTLSTTVALPPLADAGTTDVTVRLAVDDVGVAKGSPSAPVDPEPGAPGPSRVGSWPGARVQPCRGTPGPGEACVPGGAYWMGDPLLTGLAADLDADLQRLVVISPFFLDLREVTVAELRGNSFGPGTLFSWSGTVDPTMQSSWCTYTDGPGAADPTDAHASLPANCLLWTVANQFCTHHGKRLPTEAELEFAASGRGAERSYVWGNDDPACGDAVWGRGGAGLHVDENSSCLLPGDIGGVGPADRGARDRVQLTPDGPSLVDLAGNLGEYAADTWSRQGESFWGRSGVFHDPLADLRGVDGPERVIRGGTWASLSVGLRAAYRSAVPYNAQSEEIGFRCARDAR